MSIRRFLVIATWASLALPIAAAGAQQTDVIRGQVTGPDNAPLENVTVTVTSISGNVTRTARTDRAGRFTVTFPGGEGDYMVSFASIGYAARRFEVKRTADEEILIADAKLARVDAVLDPVRVTAERQRVSRNEPAPPDISGSERPLSNTAVPANLMGDLAAMAASLPGIQSVPGQDGGDGGYSAFGLGADQNNTTLNGMQFGGSNLPRDAMVSSSVATSPYDVSRGGFSGAQMSLRSRSGSNFKTRGMSLNLDAPPMQWSDRAARSLGQEYSNFSLGGTVAGPLRYDKAFYNVAYQLGRRSNDLQTLLNTNSGGLAALGIASDSVARLLSILGTAKVPVTTGSVGNDRVGDQGSVFGNFDFAPPSSSSGQALNVSFNGSWNRQNPAVASATEVPAHGGNRTSWRGGLQARQNMYVKGILSETSLGYSASRTSANPFLDLPTGSVRVNSTFDDAPSGVQSLLFGGNQFLNSNQTTSSVGFLNQLSWFSVNNRHRLRFTTELRNDGASQKMSNNIFGTYAFNSLADLAAGKPASFTRQLGPRERDVSQFVAGFSLGDSWRARSNLQIQYGVRLDANWFADAPAYNSGIDSTFAIRNDRVPERAYLSPRLGFSWTYGQAPQIAGFEGAMRGPRAVVRGGVGVFQNMPSTGLIGSALDNTGLPSAVQQLTCIGAATPVPDWAAYTAGGSGAIPVRCADGSTGTVFSNQAPNVTLFDDDYRSPRSIRSNLQWNGRVLGNRFSASFEAVYSANQNQSGIIDLNFNPVERFRLADEAGRPVYVEPTSIVPATGSTSPLDARVSRRYSRVTHMTSDFESRSRQLSARLSPATFSPSLSWSLAYVYSNVKEKFSGFSSTAGNPLEREWGRGSFDSRHQIVYNLGYNFFDFVRVNWFGQFRSGSPYSPMVAGDINGDGYANDRAYVPTTDDPDPGIASAITSLLESSDARECLRKQLGKLAGRNSCQAPWLSTASMSISFNPVKVRMPHRATLSFQLSNPLGAADLLLNGSGNLRGWGQPAFPDQQLLYVRGFDPQAQRYRYEVNQRFGTTNQSSSFRIPVTLTAMMRFDVGPTRERQMLTQQLDRGRRTNGQRAPEAMLRAMYSSGGIPNPLATILRQQDSLKLTAPQADSLATLNRLYTIRNDALWTPLAKYFAELPDGYDKDEAYAKYMEARKATIDLLIKLAPQIKGVLTADQRRKLPAFIASYLEPRYLASIRPGTAGFTGGGMFGGGVPVMMTSEMMMNAGGMERVIIRN